MTEDRFPGRVLAVTALVAAMLHPAVAAEDKEPAAAEDTETAPLPMNYGTREDVQKFAYQMAQEHDYDYDLLMTILSQAERKDSIIALMDRTPEGTWTWERYRKHFLDKQRIEAGVEFWKAHKDTLERAKKDYGVAPETIVAIIGVETRYGKVKGRTRILDALMTLAFDYPRREKFFRRELQQFLILLKEEGFQPLDMRGSYAGAMGWGQFMPSSYRAYAVDFDGDDVRDLLENPTDAIGSVANYLAEHGWRKDLTPAIRARLKSEPEDAEIRFNQRKPSYLLKELSDNLVPKSKKEARAFDADEKFIALRLKMEEPAAPQYWLGTYNLYVITRYNTSQLYAMAVHELGQTIRSKVPKSLR